MRAKNKAGPGEPSDESDRVVAKSRHRKYCLKNWSKIVVYNISFSFCKCFCFDIHIVKKNLNAAVVLKAISVLPKN